MDAAGANPVIVCGKRPVAVTWNVRLACADAYCALPDCVATIVQVPLVTSVTVAAFVVHTDVVDEPNATGSPDDALADTVNGDAVSVRSAIGAKSIVCSASDALTVIATSLVDVSAPSLADSRRTYA